MAKAKTLVGLDVHAAKIVAAVLDVEGDADGGEGLDGRGLAQASGVKRPQTAHQLDEGFGAGAVGGDSDVVTGSVVCGCGVGLLERAIATTSAS